MITIFNIAKFDKINTVLIVDFSDTKLPDWVERKLNNYEVYERKSVNGMNVVREITLVTECDHNNKWNPAKTIVDNNYKFVSDLIENCNAQLI